MGHRAWSLLAACACALAAPATLRADEITATDKLRMLYSSRFNFSDEGVPVITIEIASGDKTATLSAPGGLRILPDGAGGSRLESRKALAVTVRRAPSSRARCRFEGRLGRHAPTDVGRVTRMASVTVWSGRVACERRCP